ncbi:MAG: hypothetical protein GC162_08190 [Planctomycetes bacterium]|nr:hypothetical protein [Planctomycetota bacterium]
MTTTDIQTKARVYLVSRKDDQVVVSLPGTKYELHLRATAPVQPTPQGRLSGEIHCPVWKVDFVSAGGAFVEPVMGRPRRVQGTVVGSLPGNKVVVDVVNQPIVATLPERWEAAKIAPGTRVGLDVPEGSTFEPQ